MVEHAAKRHRAPEIEVDIVAEADSWSIVGSIDELTSRTARAVAQELDVEDNGRLAATLALMDDAGIAKLNQDFRNKSGPTNVLSFPAAPSEGDEAHGNASATPSPHYLGDIAMARETILKEAQELNISPGDHFCHLLAHGLLHLLGYDHETEDAANEMETLETSILGRIGIADPYRDS